LLRWHTCRKELTIKEQEKKNQVSPGQKEGGGEVKFSESFTEYGGCGSEGSWRKKSDFPLKSISGEVNVKVAGEWAFRGGSLGLSSAKNNARESGL